jgi:hypothetical protein
MPDTMLEGDHPRIISAKFGWDWLSSFRGEDFFLIPSPLFSILSLVIILVGSRDHWTQFGRGPPKDHSTKVWLQLAQWFLRRRLKCEMLTSGRRTKSDGNSSHGLKARWAKNSSDEGRNRHWQYCNKSDISDDVCWDTQYWHYYPLANEVAKGYSNDTVRPSILP